jgi:hypothetical protein
MTTSRGQDACPGDLICVLPSCCDPLVLHPEEEHFDAVGPCYFAGLMQGEVLCDGRKWGAEYRRHNDMLNTATEISISNLSTQLLISRLYSTS